MCYYRYHTDKIVPLWWEWGRWNIWISFNRRVSTGFYIRPDWLKFLRRSNSGTSSTARRKKTVVSLSLVLDAAYATNCGNWSHQHESPLSCDSRTSDLIFHVIGVINVLHIYTLMYIHVYMRAHNSAMYPRLHRNPWNPSALKLTCNRDEIIGCTFPALCAREKLYTRIADLRHSFVELWIFHTACDFIRSLCETLLSCIRVSPITILANNPSLHTPLCVVYRLSAALHTVKRTFWARMH